MIENLTTKERVELYTKIMPLMLNGEIDWGEGCKIRSYLNVTEEEIKEQIRTEVG